ncbi:MAG: RDD family protein [Nocardioidaceae bacterium]|nr:RDD family protein [Nocardioidaceae bacterium]
MDAGSIEQDYPGRRRGLPEEGPGAVAGWGRRVLALVIDWTLSMLAVGAFIGQDVWSGQGAARWAPLVLFGCEVWILTTLLGGSAGQLITRVVVRRTSGQPLDIFRALLRTALICLVIPPVIYNRDQQGLHDLAVDSIALRR